jgi:hypothetical protein
VVCLHGCCLVVSGWREMLGLFQEVGTWFVDAALNRQGHTGRPPLRRLEASPPLANIRVFRLVPLAT